MNLVNLLIERQKKSPSRLAYQQKELDRWGGHTWTELTRLVAALNKGLFDHGIEKGDRVAIISETRSEWMITDLAILSRGAVTVPIYPNNSDEDTQFILKNSGASIAFVESAQQLQKLQKMKANLPALRNIFVFDDLKGKSDLHWLKLVEEGRSVVETHIEYLSDAASDIMLEDVATILYTSGTTGHPKGVVLTHQQIMSELEDVFVAIPVDERDLSLTFLPFSHILGRVEMWGSIHAGFTIGFAESIERIKGNMMALQPTFILGVPRIFEKIYAGIISVASGQPLKRTIFEHAIDVGRRIAEVRQEKSVPTGGDSIQYQIFNFLVLENIRRVFGGKLRFAFSGGAPLSKELAEFYSSLGIPVYEGYGLTETTAGITFNSPMEYKLGTVGKPLGDVLLKIAEDGEILVKSKKVMREYYNDVESTKAAFEDGYFRTGDVGEIDADGFLTITDRKKDLIKTAGGKYVAPQKLEGLLKQSPLISNVLIHGDQKKYVVALVTLNATSVENWAKTNGVPVSDFKTLSQSPEVYSLVRDVVAEANSQLASFESIKKFKILPNDFTVGTGELTPSLKVKRRFCDNKFKPEIDSLYSSSAI